MPAGTFEAACAVVSTPVTSQGWRPISVTYQPASVAIQPENVMPTRSHAAKSDGRPRRQICQPANQEIASISIPTPTMTRNA